MEDNCVPKRVVELLSKTLIFLAKFCIIIKMLVCIIISDCRLEWKEKKGGYFFPCQGGGGAKRFVTDVNTEAATLSLSFSLS